MKEKRELIRIVKSPDNKVAVDDEKGKSPGRGAYICVESTCINKIIKSKSLERAFSIKIEDNVIEQILEEVKIRGGN